MIRLWSRITAVFLPNFRTKKSQRPAGTAPVVPGGIAGRVIDCATTVSNELGSGLPEIIYENALAHELRKAGLTVSQQQAVSVYYDGMIVGDYTADLLVENTVLVELQAVKTAEAANAAECMNYLKATGLGFHLIFNYSNPSLSVQYVTIAS